MSIFVRPEDRRPFKNIGDALQSGLTKGIEQGLEQDLIDRLIQKAQGGQGDYLDNLLQNIPQSGLPLDRQQAFQQTLQPQLQQRQQQRQMSLEQARSQRQLEGQGMLENLKQQNRLELEREKARSRNFTGFQEQPEEIERIQEIPGKAKPFLSQQQEEIAKENPIVNKALQNPSVSRIFERKQKAKQKIDKLKKQISQTQKSEKISEAGKKSLISGFEKSIDRQRKKLDEIGKASPEENKRLDEIKDQADKAQSGLRKTQRALELTPTVSRSQPWTVGGVILNPFKASDRARIKNKILTPEETEYTNLVFGLITDTFKTLPRIKTEFDNILRTNPSILNTEEGNRKILENMQKAYQINIRKDELRQMYENAGVPRSQIDNLIREETREEENNIIRDLNQSLLSPEQIKKRASEVLYGT